MQENLSSYGVVMAIETVVILYFIGVLMRRTQYKRKKLDHVYVSWDLGTIFMGYLISIFIYNVLDFYTICRFYLLMDSALTMDVIVINVTKKTILLLGKFLLWKYHTTFDPFKIKI